MTAFSDAAWKDMHPSMWMARVEARILHKEMTRKDLVITSGRRPRVGGAPMSKHHTGEAMDIRTTYLNDPTSIWNFADELQRRLGEDFDVVVEGPAARNVIYRDRPPHIHVEYDPKGRHLKG